MRVPAMHLAVAALSTLAVLAQQTSASNDVPEGARVVLQVKGDGVQIYTCSETPAGMKWTLKAPDARLLDGSGKIVGTHFAGPTWKLTDGGQVQGELMASRPSPDAASIPWLLLRAKAGTAAGSLAPVAYIRRTETHGGVAPAAGCLTKDDAAKTVQVPYTANYSFYAAH